MIKEDDLVTLRGFPAGQNTVAPETALPEGSLRRALNVDLDDGGKVYRRPGRTLTLAATAPHSLWSDGEAVYYVSGTELLRGVSLSSPPTVIATVSADLPVSFCKVNEVPYWSNGVESGRILSGVSEPWSVPTPPWQPAATAVSTGGMPAGRYQVAITFARRGEEGGAIQPTILSVPAGGGIDLSAIPQNPAADSVRVYLSTPDGDQLYFHSYIPAATTTASLVHKNLGKPLATLFLDEMPAGRIVRHKHGRLWVANSNILACSEALRYGLTNPGKHFFLFPADITVLEPVDDGAYVVADKTYFLGGTSPEAMTQRVVLDATGVFGTGMTLAAHRTGLQATGELAYWVGSIGPVLGLPGGQVMGLTKDRAYDVLAESGASLYRERAGRYGAIRQVVSALRQPVIGVGDELGYKLMRNDVTVQSIGVGDDVESEIIRNGVTVQ